MCADRSVTMRITVRPTLRPITSDSSTQTTDWELMVRRYIRKAGLYTASVARLEGRFFLGFVNCLVRPAGRADKAGSQMCEFEMEVSNLEPIHDLLKGEGLQYHPQSRYTVDPDTGEIAWMKSGVIDTYYLETAEEIADFLSLHERKLGAAYSLHASSRGATTTEENGYLDVGTVVTVMALPPLCIEMCSRSGGKYAIRSTFNKATHNDLNGFRLPPHYQYHATLGPRFKALMLTHVQGMVDSGMDVSDRFRDLLLTEEF